MKSSLYVSMPSNYRQAIKGGHPPVGRSFANLHIKSGDLDKTLQALKELIAKHGKVLGYPETPERKAVIYVSQSNEGWISVLHDYFVWGTVKKVGRTLSGLLDEPVMTVAYMNEEIFELSFFEQGRSRPNESSVSRGPGRSMNSCGKSV